MPAVVTAWRFAAVGDPPSVLDTRGPAAEAIATAWWILLVLGVGAFLVAMGFLTVASLRTARRTQPGARFIVGWGVVFPAVLFTMLLGLHLWSGGMTYRPGNQPAVAVEIVGAQFWWEMTYEDDDGEVVTANELVVPAGQPVELRLRSADVIHSFWVPALQGKMDMIPGRTNVFWLEADEPGMFHGYCAEFCGIQHARMQITVVALEAEAFQDWLAEQREDAAPPASTLARQGMEVFAEVGCASCHGVRGQHPDPPRRIAPDLTHMASRRTLAAGTIPNDRENLRRWIVAPQEIKPGNRMPATTIDADRLEALLAYLEGLR